MSEIVCQACGGSGRPPGASVGDVWDCPTCNGHGTLLESKPLKSVDSHNAERLKARQGYEERRRRTGVACPKCGKELLWEDCYTQVATYPPPTDRPAKCGPCGLVISLEE